MFHQQHTVDTINQASIGELLSQGTNYPIGMTVEKYMDFVSDVKTLTSNIVLEVTPFTNVTPTSNLEDILSQLAARELNQGVTSTVQGDSRRQILPVGRVDKNLEFIAGAGRTFSLTNAPYFFIAGFPGSVVIDCTKSKFSLGLIYPFISISLTSTIGSNVGSLALSTIDFDNYGSVPIYGPSDILIQSSVVVGGAINIKNRFTDLEMSTQVVRRGGSVTFSSTTMKDLAGFNKAFLNEVSTDVSASQSSIRVTIPENGKTGYIRLEQTEPVYNSFLSDRIIVT